jgi:hypothetical protein
VQSISRWIGVIGLGATSAVGALAAHATPVEYRLRIERFWDESDVEAGTYPGGAHFTPFAIATHDATPLWVPGQPASRAIEDVAELGVTTLLELDVRDRIRAGTAGTYLEGDAIFPVDGSIEHFVRATTEHRFLSVIAMIAPSPDWFVGVSSVDLAPNGEFVPELAFELRAWDAGTENGGTFRLTNPDTEPRGVITRRLRPFVGDPLLARLTLTLVPEPESALLLALGLALLGVTGGRSTGR